uniref:RWD domain-containing protein 3 n=1 Tax=Takifugu rubripes TaxID=31033 RepID=A0A3B5JX54_TAKRU
MSEAALEEVSVLSSIYCGEEEFQLVHRSGQDGLVVHIKQTVGGEGGPDISLSFHLPPAYPSCPPGISVTSTRLSKTQSLHIRQKLLDQAAALPAEPMLHRLVEGVQVRVLLRSHTHTHTHTHSSTYPDRTVVLLLDHIRDRRRYIKLLERWTHQLQLSGMLFLGRSILLILQGDRLQVKEFCRLLKTVKIDVDSSGKKCKEKMMKVLIEASQAARVKPAERLQNGLQIQEDVQEHGKRMWKD